MSNPATTPANRWGLKVPVAAYGAAQLPIPQPATAAEANTDAFRQRLRAAITAQIDANAEAREARDASGGTPPYRMPSSPGRGGAILTPTQGGQGSSPTGDGIPTPAGAADWSDIVGSLNAERGVSRPAAIDHGAIYAARAQDRQPAVPASSAAPPASAWDGIVDGLNHERGVSHPASVDPGAIYATRRSQNGGTP